MHTLHL